VNITLSYSCIGPDGSFGMWVRFGDGPKIPFTDLTPEQLKRVKAAGLLRNPPAKGAT
jgi:hypothetical protein